MPLGGALIGAAVVAPILGGIIGNMSSASDRKKAQAANDKALKSIEAVGAPPDLSKQIILNEYRQAGILTPELEQNIDAGVSRVSQIKEDPALREAQMKALDLISKRGVTGLGPEDRAALNQIRSRVQQDMQAKSAQIQQNMQARGIGGSGADLAAQLSNAQAGAQQASEQSDTIGAQASQRALQALQASGTLGSQIRGQEFDINKAREGAADEFRKFDVQNQLGVQSRNVGAKNQAQQFNLTNLQDIMNRNTQAQNSEKARQMQGQQMNWESQLARGGALAGALNQSANVAQQRAAQTGQMWSNIGSGVGSAAGAGAGFVGQQNAASATKTAGEASNAAAAQRAADQQAWQERQNELDRKAYGGG